jgi:signal transduction histidine kinase
MSHAAAVALMLGGASLCLSLDRGRWRTPLSLACAAGTTALGAWSLGVAAAGLPALSPWLRSAIHVGSAVIGQPIAALAALDLVLLGGALLLSDAPGSRRWPPAQVLALAALILALIVAYGHVYRLTWFDPVPAAAELPWVKTVLLTVLSAGILVARPDRGVAALLTSEGPAGSVARGLVPVVVGGPWVLGWAALALHRIWPGESPLALVQILAASTIALLSGVALEIGFALDQSDRVRRTAERALRTSEERLQAIVDGSFDGILVHDGQVVVDASGRLVAMLGLDRTDAVGRPLATLFTAPICLPATHGTKRARPVEGIDRCGCRIPLEVVCHDYADDDRQLHVAAIRDRAEILRLESRLRQAQQLELLGQLAATIVHDLNNALTVILGFAEDLRDDPVVSRRQHEALAGLTSAAAAAGDMLTRLQTFARRDPGSKERVSVQAFLQEVQPLLVRATGPAIQVEIAVEPGTPALDVDRTQLVQALMNLAMNARDAMPGGGRLRVTARPLTLDQEDAESDWSALEPGAYVLLEVSDTGAGITAEVLPFIFDPFFTTKPPGKGTGLGLASVLSIARQHEGDVAVDTAPGRGATFRIALRAAESVCDRRHGAA